MVETSVIVDTILRLDKQPSLYHIHQDLIELVKIQHPSLYKDIQHPMTYHAIGENILDGYKNVAHIMLLNKFPGLKNNDVVRTDHLLEELYKKFDIQYDEEKIETVSNELTKIIDKHCGRSLDSEIIR